MSTVANLQAARAAIAIQSKWTTGTLRDKKGSMCALGAVATVLSLPIKDGSCQDNEDTYERLATTPEVRFLGRAARRMRGAPSGIGESPVSVIYGVNDSRMPFKSELTGSGLYAALSEGQAHARVLKMFDEAIKEALSDDRLLP